MAGGVNPGTRRLLTSSGYFGYRQAPTSSRFLRRRQGATARTISEGNRIIMATEPVSGVFDGRILLTFGRSASLTFPPCYFVSIFQIQ